MGAKSRKGRKSKKRVKKKTICKQKQNVDTIWKNPKYMNQLTEKLHKLAKRRQSDEESTSSTSPTTSFDQDSTAEDARSCTACSEIDRLDADFTIPHLTFAENGIQAMATLHNMLTNSEVKFRKDAYKLEQDYMKNYYLPLINVRRTLLNQSHHESRKSEIATAIEDCTPLLSSGCRDAKNVKDLLRRMARGEREQLINDFWPKVIRNSHPLLRSLLQPHDYDVLSHLTDIGVELIDVEDDNRLRACASCFNDNLHEGHHAFELKFMFGPNPYFENEVLRKRYVISLVPDLDDYLNVHKSPKNMLDTDDDDSDGILYYKGPRLVAIKGTKIDWFSECFKESHQSVFTPIFSYFQRNWDRSSDECNEIIRQDYQLGCYFRDTMIPRAYALYHNAVIQTEECLHESARAHLAVEVKPGAVDLPDRVEDTDPAATTSNLQDSGGPVCSSRPDTEQEEVDVTYVPDTTDDAGSASGLSHLEDDVTDDLEKRGVLGEERRAAKRREKLDKIVHRVADSLEYDLDVSAAEQQALKASQGKVDEGNANYDEVDDVVVLPPDYDEVDDVVCIPPKRRRLFDDPTKEEEAKVLVPVAMHPCDPESISASRKRMEEIMGRVNILLREKGQFINGIHLDTKELNKVIKNRVRDEVHLGHVKTLNEESEIPLSDDLISLEGNLAEDEEDWSDYQPPSVTTHFKKICLKMNPGFFNPQKQCDESGATDDDASGSRKPCENRIKFINVPAYPSDSTAEDVVCRSAKSTDQEDGFFNIATPSTSGSDVEESQYLRRSKRTLDDTENSVPLCSTGVKKAAEISLPLDYDSEAPTEPPGEIDSCKQQ